MKIYRSHCEARSPDHNGQKIALRVSVYHIHTTFPTYHEAAKIATLRCHKQGPTDVAQRNYFTPRQVIRCFGSLDDRLLPNVYDLPVPISTFGRTAGQHIVPRASMRHTNPGPGPFSAHPTFSSPNYGISKIATYFMLCVIYMYLACLSRPALAEAHSVAPSTSKLQPRIQVVETKPKVNHLVAVKTQTKMQAMETWIKMQDLSASKMQPKMYPMQAPMKMQSLSAVKTQPKMQPPLQRTWRNYGSVRHGRRRGCFRDQGGADTQTI